MHTTVALPDRITVQYRIDRLLRLTTHTSSQPLHAEINVSARYLLGNTKDIENDIFYVSLYTLVFVVNLYDKPCSFHTTITGLPSNKCSPSPIVSLELVPTHGNDAQ